MDAEALLGPLPEDWKRPSRLRDASEEWYPAFAQETTGKLQATDPRLGPLPAGWRMTKRAGSTLKFRKFETPLHYQIQGLQLPAIQGSHMSDCFPNQVKSRIAQSHPGLSLVKLTLDCVIPFSRMQTSGRVVANSPDAGRHAGRVVD